MPIRDITISIVSHRQNELVNQLLRDLETECTERISIVLTQNAPDPVAFSLDAIPAPVTLIRNAHAKGFGANHNAAFAHCETPFFCVCNPDIRLAGDPFGPLLDVLSDESVGVSAPRVLNPEGDVQDSARRYPTVASLLGRLLSRTRLPDYRQEGDPIGVDWVGGMFMVFRREVFREVGGFDENYFLYYEDVDLCWRLSLAGLRVILQPRALVVHDARRGSHRDLALARRHVTSACRFLWRRALARRGLWIGGERSGTYR